MKDKCPLVSCNFSKKRKKRRKWPGHLSDIGMTSQMKCLYFQGGIRLLEHIGFKTDFFVQP